ncbi:MAG: inositol monophosphatase [Candidatus Moranbacteria bacterium]|nr:inositol monophosphatase [Candidatus Moranbacteria bacterium]
MSKYSNELEVAKRAAQEAGKIVKEMFFGSFDTFVKDDRSYVTSADLEAERKIIEIVSETFPEHRIMSEEAGGNGKDSKFSWVIDPIDGTTNFSKKIPFFNIAVALEVNGRVVLGAVFQPITNELFWAEKEQGAFLNEKRIFVDSETKYNDAFFGYCHGKSVDDIKYMIDMMKKVKPEAREFRKFGSADLELCYVACGRLNGFVAKGVKLMDFKPGCIIAQEAGAIITDFSGKDWQGNTNGDVLTTSSKELHEKLLSIV